LSRINIYHFNDELFAKLLVTIIREVALDISAQWYLCDWHMLYSGGIAAVSLSRKKIHGRREACWFLNSRDCQKSPKQSTMCEETT